jgi:hypothetical protein
MIPDQVLVNEIFLALLNQSMILPVGVVLPLLPVPTPSASGATTGGLPLQIHTPIQQRHFFELTTESAEDTESEKKEV